MSRGGIHQCEASVYKSRLEGGGGSRPVYGSEKESRKPGVPKEERWGGCEPGGAGARAGRKPGFTDGCGLDTGKRV